MSYFISDKDMSQRIGRNIVATHLSKENNMFLCISPIILNTSKIYYYNCDLSSLFDVMKCYSVCVIILKILFIYF